MSRSRMQGFREEVKWEDINWMAKMVQKMFSIFEISVVVLLLFYATTVFCIDSITVMEGATTSFHCESPTEPVWEQKLKMTHINLAFGAKKFPNFKDER